MQLTPAKRGVDDFDDDVRIRLDFGDWPVFKLDLVRPFENYCPHCLSRHDLPVSFLGLFFQRRLLPYELDIPQV